MLRGEILGTWAGGRSMSPASVIANLPTYLVFCVAYHPEFLFSSINIRKLQVYGVRAKCADSPVLGVECKEASALE